MSETKVEEKQNKKKSGKSRIISSIVLVLSLALLTYAIVMRVTGNTPQIFGYSFHVVVTDSMTPEINVGDFIVAKKEKAEEVKLGDYIVFKSLDPDPQINGKTIIHKVINITDEDGDGKREFTTQGIKQYAPVDEYKPTEIIGIYVGKSVFLGSVIVFLANWVNLAFIAVLIILLVVIIIFAKKAFRIFKEEKAAQTGGGQSGEQIEKEPDPLNTDPSKDEPPMSQDKDD